MERARGRELGVEGGGHDPPLAHQHRLAGVPAEHLDVGAERAEARGADEDGLDGAAERRRVDARLERVDLAAEGVALDHGVEQAEARLARAHLAREQDRAGAGAGDDAARRVEGARAPRTTARRASG